MQRAYASRKNSSCFLLSQMPYSVPPPAPTRPPMSAPLPAPLPPLAMAPPAAPTAAPPSAPIPASLPTSTSLPFEVGKRSEEHTSELQSLRHLVCRLLLEKKKA